MSITFRHAFALLVLPALPVAAQDGANPPTPADVQVGQAREAGVFTIYFENDSFAKTDQHYTNGTKLSWLTDDLSDWGQRGWRKRFLNVLPFLNRPDTQKNFGFSLGQNIYTPRDTSAAIPDPTDRPYAGWSYLEFSFVSKNHSRVDIFSLQAGMVGPSSFAEETQRRVHEWINSNDPQGWDYQLRDELGVNLIYERRYRTYGRALADTLGVDFIPHGGFSLGNVQTYANLGATLRFGFNLPSDFGVQLSRGGAIGASPADDLDPRVSLTRNFSLFVFAGADGRAVAQDIFLDGNTWKDGGPSVEKERFVADLMGGVGLVAGRWQLTGTLVHRTQEFTTQSETRSRFGSVTVSMAF